MCSLLSCDLDEARDELRLRKVERLDQDMLPRNEAGAVFDEETGEFFDARVAHGRWFTRWSVSDSNSTGVPRKSSGSKNRGGSSVPRDDKSRLSFVMRGSARECC